MATVPAHVFVDVTFLRKRGDASPFQFSLKTRASETSPAYPIDLTGRTILFKVMDQDFTVVMDGEADVTNGPLGEAEYTPTSDEVDRDPGDYLAEVWVDGAKYPRGRRYWRIEFGEDVGPPPGP